MIPLSNFFGPELLILFFGFLSIVVPIIIIVLIARYVKRRGDSRMRHLKREIEER